MTCPYHSNCMFSSFTRYVYDEETEVYYLRSRYYNPLWHRFVNSDSLTCGNLYHYSSNSPILRIDTNGFSDTLYLATYSNTYDKKTIEGLKSDPNFQLPLGLWPSSKNTTPNDQLPALSCVEDECYIFSIHLSNIQTQEIIKSMHENAVVWGASPFDYTFNHLEGAGRYTVDNGVTINGFNLLNCNAPSVEYTIIAHVYKDTRKDSSYAALFRVKTESYASETDMDPLSVTYSDWLMLYEMADLSYITMKENVKNLVQKVLFGK